MKEQDEGVVELTTYIVIPEHLKMHTFKAYYHKDEHGNEARTLFNEESEANWFCEKLKESIINSLRKRMTEAVESGEIPVAAEGGK